jgi:hypothetical protein
MSLVFEINNNHLHPVMDLKKKEQVFKRHSIDMVQYKFDVMVTETNYEYVNHTQLIHPTFANRIILVEEDDLCLLASEITKITSYMPTHIHFLGSKITMFEHPKTNHIIVAAPRERKCVRICIEREETTASSNGKINHGPDSQNCI